MVVTVGRGDGVFSLSEERGPPSISGYRCRTDTKMIEEIQLGVEAPAAGAAIFGPARLPAHDVQVLALRIGLA